MKMRWFTLLFAILQISWISAERCDWRYYQHYEHKGSSAVLGENGCPVRFHCDPLSKEMRQKCLHKGRAYAVTEEIEDLEACSSCSCEHDRYGEASIECASVDCPDWEPQDKSCRMGYFPDQCCPEEICPPEDEKMLNACHYNSKSYHVGQFIHTNDPCTACLCTEKWNGKEYGPGCKKVDCLLGIYAKNIRNGCLVIYRENSCCPSGVECGNIYGATPVDFPRENKEDLCHYNGKYYARGSTAFIASDNSENIICECSVPPDFTCVRRLH